MNALLECRSVLLSGQLDGLRRAGNNPLQVVGD
jgi:hypothetical protein